MGCCNDSLAQLKAAAPVLTGAYAAVAGLLIVVVIVSAQFDIAVARFTSDPAAVSGAHPFVGVLSNIGILLWCSAAAVCLFAAAIQSQAGQVKAATFLLFSGLLTSVLLLDDLFMLHEAIIPDYLHVSQILVFAGYLLVIAGYFARFRRAILETDYILLLMACAFLGLSVICDVTLPNEGIEFLVEDGLKLFGIMTWLIYFSRTGLQQIRQLVAD